MENQPVVPKAKGDKPPPPLKGDYARTFSEGARTVPNPAGWCACLKTRSPRNAPAMGRILRPSAHDSQDHGRVPPLLTKEGSENGAKAQPRYIFDARCRGKARARRAVLQAPLDEGAACGVRTPSSRTTGHPTTAARSRATARSTSSPIDVSVALDSVVRRASRMLP